jgi:flavodoxin
MENKKILTVYFSLQGHTRAVAKEINAVAGGDIVEIELKTPYVKNYFTALISGGIDIARGSKPEIKNNLDISGYDLIFAGGPVWFWTICPPLKTFLNNWDFKGKTVVPFCTQGSSAGKYFEKFANNITGAKILGGIDFDGKTLKNTEEVKTKLKKWVLDIIK